ncbi:ATP-binding cassette domain-containing protein [Umezawaea endophytica]|uniref:ABC transporter ATP-binding protein n=1 Tax=Umezawaea endophytica TaxID=1654476 RepID=A0A9X3AIX9_9PSEU|nr:ABC transporter ATP-binding protein [Umezawaea endophytica]MCS7483166.1 ABC transporter ATP-binding protein [Umezawaea endophytica]
MIQLERIGKRYGRGPWVLQDVDLSFEPGELTVFTGGNGSGKSTLLRIIAGVTAPSSGRVHGRPKSVGYLPERFPPGLRLSAEAYLRHLAAVRGVTPPTDLLDVLGFHGDPTAPISTLSKGNTQKVAVVQAFLATDLVVLDEPWTGLDTAASSVLSDLVSSSAATVLVTDHRGTARGLAGAREVVLQGRVGATGVAIELNRVSDLTTTVIGEWDGVRVVAATDGRLSLLVDATVSDRVLADALRLGCSVLSVRT